MKKIIIIAISFALALSLCACTSAPMAGAADAAQTPAAQAPDAQEPAAQEPAAIQSSEAVTDPVGAQVDAEAAGRLTAILGDIAANYFPGTAGCSLTGAKFAGELLDCFAELALDAGTVKAAALDALTGLDEPTALEFPQKLADIYGIAKELTASDTAADLLSSAGYEPRFFPWQEGSAQTLFASVFEGIGAQLPE